MKKIIISVLLSFFAITAFSQDLWKLSFSAFGASSYNSKYIHGNIGVDFSVAKCLDLHYSLGMGTKSNGKFCMRMPYTIPFGLVFLNNGYGALLLLLPQGLSFNVQLKDNVELSPFVNFNTAELIFDDYADDKYFYVADIGLKCRYYFSESFFVQAAAAMKIEQTGDFGVVSEAGLGVKF